MFGPSAGAVTESVTESVIAALESVAAVAPTAVELGDISGLVAHAAEAYVAESDTESATESATESITESVTESATESITESITDSVDESDLTAPTAAAAAAAVTDSPP